MNRIAVVFFFALLIPATLCADEGHLRAGAYLDRYEWDYVSTRDKTYWRNTVEDSQLYYATVFQKFDILTHFFFSADTTVYMLKVRENASFSPIFLDYSVRAGIQFANVEIGFQHSCNHPQNTAEGIASPVISRNSASEQIYIQFSWRSK